MTADPAALMSKGAARLVHDLLAEVDALEKMLGSRPSEGRRKDEKRAPKRSAHR